MRPIRQPAPPDLLPSDFPTVSDREAGDQSTVEISAPTRGRPVVLVIEDEPGVRSLAKLALEHAGFQTLVAASGDEAVRAADGHRGGINLIIADVRIPGSPGCTLVQRVRARHPGVRVLYVSRALPDGPVLADIQAARAHFLPKPFGLMTFIRKVRQVLGLGGD